MDAVLTDFVNQPGDREREHEFIPSPAKSNTPTRKTCPGSESHVNAQKKMRWYVVQTYSGYENKVRESLQQRIKRAQQGGAASARS